MPESSACYLFAGPTLSWGDGSTLPVPPEIQVLPPAQRGDVTTLVTNHAPATLVLVDGKFHYCPAVGHVELRKAIEKGWKVWGLGSMGAIRAYEMRNLGMRGFGQVYARFLEEEDFQDDEVTLLHEPDAPYRPLSEPLIHCRMALQALQTKGLLSSEQQETITDHLKSRWYGERTLPLLAEQVRHYLAPSQEGLLQETLTHFDLYRVKTHDLQTFLQQKRWDS